METINEAKGDTITFLQKGINLAFSQTHIAEHIRSYFTVSERSLFEPEEDSDENEHPILFNVFKRKRLWKTFAMKQGKIVNSLRNTDLKANIKTDHDTIVVGAVSNLLIPITGVEEEVIDWENAEAMGRSNNRKMKYVSYELRDKLVNGKMKSKLSPSLLTVYPNDIYVAPENPTQSLSRVAFALFKTKQLSIPSQKCELKKLP